MTLPTDFDSFAFGFDLTEANYSSPGSGSGTFANLVSGEDDWTHGANTPSFTTKSGSGWSIEGKNFGGVIGDIVQGKMRAMQECTVLAIAEVPNTASQYIMGGLNTGANTWGLYTTSQQGRLAGNGFSDTAQTGTTVTSSTPFVICGSFSPMNGTIYVQVNGSAVATDASLTGANPSFTPYWQAAIGAMRTTYMSGWVARVLVFSRALHFRDNTNLQSLIATEMAKIGL